MYILKASIIEPYTPSSRKNNKIKDEEKEEITFIIFLMYHSKNYFLTCTSSNFCDVYIYFCDHKIILLKSSKKNKQYNAEILCFFSVKNMQFFIHYICLYNAFQWCCWCQKAFTKHSFTQILTSSLNPPVTGIV